MLITAAVCIPYIFIFMESIAHSLFRNRKGPSLFDIMIVFFLEAIHSFGLCLLVFRVLPSCDVIRALLLLNCLCIIPGFCKMIFSKNSAGPIGKALIVMIDFIALAAQLSVFFVIMCTEYTAFIDKADTKVPEINQINTVDSFNDPFADAEAQRQSTDFTMNGSSEKPKWKGSWEAPFALLFTSIAWWENFIDRDIKLGCINMPLASYKRHLQSVRSKANIGASLWKIALTIAFSVIMLPSKRFENAFVQMPTIIDPPATNIFGGSEKPGEQIVDFGGMDASSFDNHINKRQAEVESIIETTMKMLTVPNNAWNNPTTPNLFDFTASKVN